MDETPDAVTLYGKSSGFVIRDRTVIVEGNTDVALFELAAHLDCQATGVELLGSSLAVVSPGTGDLGGTRGVIRELTILRGLAKIYLLPNGRPRYRFIGLFDSDRAGRQAVGYARDSDTSILEYKDVFRLQPIMPVTGNLDPKALQTTFERENAAHKGKDWELEDVLPTSFVETFLNEYPEALVRAVPIGEGKLHRDFTKDGKARLHKFARENAMREDLVGVVEVLKALRFYCGLK
jgi:hypothetical protein